VIVFDADFVGMSLFPTESEAVLLVHADAVATSPTPLQTFEPVARWNREVLESSRHVQHLQLALNDRPNVARHGAGEPAVPFAEEVCGRLVGEAVNHGAFTYYTGNM
jgi:hypothetical protein